MIITKCVTIKGNGSNMKYYRDIGYNIEFRKPCKIKVCDLKQSSKVKIKVQCDNEECSIQKEIPYSDYRKSIEKTNTYFCNKCCYEKTKTTNLEKYGVEYALQSKFFFL